MKQLKTIKTRLRLCDFSGIYKGLNSIRHVVPIEAGKDIFEAIEEENMSADTLVEFFESREYLR